jgi:hypothetical protein
MSSSSTDYLGYEACISCIRIDESRYWNIQDEEERTYDKGEQEAEESGRTVTK